MATDTWFVTCCKFSGVTCPSTLSVLDVVKIRSQRSPSWRRRVCVTSDRETAPPCRSTVTASRTPTNSSVSLLKKRYFAVRASSFLALLQKMKRSHLNSLIRYSLRESCSSSSLVTFHVLVLDSRGSVLCQRTNINYDYLCGYFFFRFKVDL